MLLIMKFALEKFILNIIIGGGLVVITQPTFLYILNSIQNMK